MEQTYIIHISTGDVVTAKFIATDTGVLAQGQGSNQFEATQAAIQETAASGHFGSDALKAVRALELDQ